MSYLVAKFYDKMLATAEEVCLRDWRRELLKNISGNVLEIGAGTGSNIKFYPSSVSSLVLSEPDKHMRHQLEQKMTNTKLNITLASGSAEKIEAQDESFDVVVSTLVCCSVTNLEKALAEIKRVLTVNGLLIFLEHVAADQGTKRRRWQNIINPFWRKLAGNCHLNRETESAILAAGFEIMEIKRESMRKVISVVRPTIRGIAIKTH